MGTDINDVPEKARQRAEAEHLRFAEMSLDDQQRELEGLASLKRQMMVAQANVRQAVDSENKAIEEVPERAEMLSQLRKQFPGIDFTAR